MEGELLRDIEGKTLGPILGPLNGGSDLVKVEDTPGKNDGASVGEALGLLDGQVGESVTLGCDDKLEIALGAADGNVLCLAVVGGLLGDAEGNKEGAKLCKILIVTEGDTIDVWQYRGRFRRCSTR